MQNQWLIILSLALALILPVSSLIRRKLPARSFMTMALAWCILFAVIAAAFKAAGL